MRYTVITLFPNLVRPWLEESLLKKALERGLIQVEVVDLRAFGLGRHRTVDDTPYGGGAGMVIRPDVAVAALERALPADEVVLLSPAGRPFTQKVAEELAGKEHLVLLAGRYEGVDERLIERRPRQQFRLRDDLRRRQRIAEVVVDLSDCLAKFRQPLALAKCGGDSFLHALQR